MSSSETDSKKPCLVSDSSEPDSQFSTKTPNRTSIQPTRSQDPNLQTKPVKRQIFSSPSKPERFMILEEFFNGLDTAIRLLKLKGSSTSFANICPKIEFITKRGFSYGDLAQMMHIYPEAIEVKRVLKCDQGTSCMKPSLHVNLNTDAVVLDDDTSCGGTKYMELRRVFHSKLVDFFKAHPKDEIPKELLPEPFNSDSYSEKISLELGARKLEVEGVDVLMEEMEQEKQIPDSTLLAGTEECALPLTESIIVGTPVKDLSTPSKDLSTPIRLMSATPSLRASRKSITMTPDDHDDSVRSTGGLERRSSRTRCLDFDSLEDHALAKDDISKVTIDKPVDEGIDYEADDASDEDNLLQSMKERPKTEAEKHNLPKLVDFIHKMFQSTKQTVITKDELLYKIIASQIEITDRKEVEEQLSLMLQLVPDWISETKASSGDFLVRINKMSSAETVCARLEDATSQAISTVN